MPYILPDWVPVAVAAAVCLFTYLRGDRETQIASTYCAVTLPVGDFVPFRNEPYFQCVWQLLDVVVFFALARGSSRWWTLVMASISLVYFVTTTALIWSHLSHWAIGTAQLVWMGAYLVTIVFAACTVAQKPSARRPVEAVTVGGL